jgi:hypothetical protein
MAEPIDVCWMMVLVAKVAWRPVVAINDRGLVLGIDRDGSWQVTDDGLARGPAHGPNLMMLLPLLERPYRQVADAVVEHVPAGCPGGLWDELLVFALDWPTDYWPGAALGWLESGYPLSGVRRAVARAADDRRKSQPLRHRALRLDRQADR